MRMAANAQDDRTVRHKNTVQLEDHKEDNAPRSPRGGISSFLGVSIITHCRGLLSVLKV